jgi:tetratricopeptide (TPR) repeat protein
MADDRKLLLDRLEAKYQQAATGDLLSLLEADESFGASQLKEAFFKLARQFHPDVMSRLELDPRDIEKGRFVFRKLSEAYNTLTDDGRRAAYISKLKRAAPSEPTASRTPDEEAEILYHKAHILLRRGAHSEAVEFLKRALQLRKDEPRYLLDLGWTIFQDASRPMGERLEEAKMYFTKVLDGSAQNATAYYYMALYHKARNHAEDAYSALKDALAVDPSFTPARRELRLLALRIKKQREADKNPLNRLVNIFKNMKLK